MLKPTLPPETGNDTSSRFWQELEAKLAPLEDTYLHWHDLQHKTMPVQGINHKQWWQLLKAKRRARLQKLPMNIGGQTFYWVLDDDLLKQLTRVERELSIGLPKQFPDWLPADNFIVETIATAHLAGVNINQDVANDVLSAGRPGANDAEHLLESIYHAMQGLQQTTLTPALLLTLNQTLLNNVQATWRSSDYEVSQNEESLYQAPPASEIAPAVEQLCAFANSAIETHKGYLHPILKAILLHYLLAAIHPFADGNGRVARALFYWQMLQAGYRFMEVISLSSVLRQDHEAYYRAFLYTQTDANDVTYFLMQQLHSLQQAIEAAKIQLQHKIDHMATLPDNLTLRQQHVLVEMRQDPLRQYRLARYKQRMQITYETSRTDLMKLAKQGLAKQHKIGKAFIYQLG